MTLLAERLGPERAAVVIERLGGQRIAVPERLEGGRATGALAKALGDELAIALVIHFGGSLIYVPLGSRSTASLSRVVRLTRSGKSANAIARRLGCSDRTVYARRAEARTLGLLPEK